MINEKFGRSRRNSELDCKCVLECCVLDIRAQSNGKKCLIITLNRKH